MPDTPPDSARPRDRALLALGAALLLVVPCAIPTLWDKHEGRFFEAARGMLATGDWIVPRNVGEPLVFYPPLCSWLIAICARLFGGLGPLAARFPSALAGVGCVLMAYELGVLLFDRRTGLFAALALLTTPFWPKTAIVCQPDTLVVLLLMVSLYALLRIERAEKRRWPWDALYWAAIAVSFLAKGPPGPVSTLAVTGAYVAWERKWRLAWQVNPLLGGAIVAVLVPPWFLAAHRAAGPGYLDRMWHEVFDMAAGGQMLMHRQPPHYYLPKLLLAAPWVFFALAALVPASADPRERSSRRFLACWAGVILLLLSVAQAKRPYYLLPVFPAIAILAASWWTRVPRWGSAASRWRERGPVLVVAVFVLAALVVPFVIPDARLAKQDVSRGLFLLAGLGAAAAGTVFVSLHVSDRRRGGFVALAVMLFAALAVQQTWGAHLNDRDGRKGAAWCAGVRARIGPGAPLVLHHVESFVPFYLATPFSVARTPEDAVLEAQPGRFLVTEKFTWQSLPELQAAWLPLEEAGTEMGNLVLCRPKR